MGLYNTDIWPYLPLGLSGSFLVSVPSLLISKYDGSYSLLSPTLPSAVQNPYPVFCYEPQHSPETGILEKPASPSSKAYIHMNANVLAELGFQL